MKKPVMVRLFVVKEENIGSSDVFDLTSSGYFEEVDKQRTLLDLQPVLNTEVGPEIGMARLVTLFAGRTIKDGTVVTYGDNAYQVRNRNWQAIGWFDRFGTHGFYATVDAYPDGSKWICKLSEPYKFGTIEVAIGVGEDKDAAFDAALERYNTDFGANNN